MHRHLHEHSLFSRGGHGHFGGGRGGFFSRFGNGGGRGGPGMRAAKMLSSDDLQLVILSLLEKKPRHGYEIIKALEEHSSRIYVPSPGMVYPALTYLEETNFAASVTEGTKKLFSITEAGAEHLEKNRKLVDETLEQLAQFGQRMAQFQEQATQEEAEDEKWGGSPRDQMKKEWRQMREEFHEIKRELKAALFSKMLAPLEEKKRVLDVLRKAIAEIRKNA